jgi:hypothetical protein
MSVSSSTRLRALVLAVACVTSLGLVACGGGDDTSSTPATTPVGATGTGGDTSSSGAVSGDIRDQFDQAVRQSLETAAANGAPIDVDCAVDKLQDALSDDEVQQIVDAFQNGQSPPSSIQQDITSVATECVSQ